MAWAACWTLQRSLRPLQRLGEQGDVGRGLSPVFVPSVHQQASLCSSSFCPISHLSMARVPLSTFLSLSGLALLSEVEGS